MTYIVFYVQKTNRAFLSVRLVYPVSQCRAGPVCTTAQTVMQPLQLAYQMFPIGGTFVWPSVPCADEAFNLRYDRSSASSVK